VGSETVSIKSGQLKQALVDANPGSLKREHIRVHVASGNRLKEVWICLSGVANPQPIACPAGGTPDSQQIKVKAPRPSSTPPAPAIDEPGDAADLACPARQSRFAEYKTAAKNALWSMYPNGGKELYCQAPFASGSARKTTGGLQLNIEHVLPKSKISVIAGQGDLHNLWPSILKVNEARSNYSLTEDIPGERWTFADAGQEELASCDFEVESVQRPGGKVTVVEPAPHARGRIARTVLHMALAYQVRLSESEWAMYVAWHEHSAPAADEQRRNDEIEQLQGTRNPFIDSPAHGRVLVQSCKS
jgi:deoxyribonuclease I